jgi:esterase/lipase superfamily enzyme
MHRQFVKWWSPSLGKEMEMLVFGHSGAPVLVFPSSMGRFFEWEDFHMIDTVRYQIENGFNQFYCVDSVDKESFYNRSVDPFTRFMRYRQYEQYITDEVIPFVHNNNPNRYIISTGASFGAYHACNIALKNPWLFGKLIAMSGKYDIRSFTDGFYDENVYFNNPVDYMPNMTDHGRLEAIRRLDLRFVAGDHDICLDATRHFCDLLYKKGIWYELDVWSPGVIHDWHEWRRMILKHLP